LYLTSEADLATRRPRWRTAPFSIPGVGNANLSGTDNPAARIVVTCDPGSLPNDSSGTLIRNNGFGSINGVAAPRDEPARDPSDVLVVQ
jgi:hypothetical protein